MKCAACPAELAPLARFCTDCGAPQATPVAATPQAPAGLLRHASFGRVLQHVPAPLRKRALVFMGAGGAILALAAYYYANFNDLFALLGEPMLFCNPQGACYLAYPKHVRSDGILILALLTLVGLVPAVVGYGLAQGTPWARRFLGPLARDPGVTAYFETQHMCPVCSQALLGAAGFCGGCGAAVAPPKESFGAKLALSVRRLVRAQPPEPARAQAFAVRASKAVENRTLLAAIVLLVVGIYVTEQFNFLSSFGITLLTFVPPILLLVWLRNQDSDREPMVFMGTAFAWGFFSAFLVMALNTTISDLTGGLSFTGGVTEEPAKALFVFLLGSHMVLRRELNGPLDGLLYGGAVGLGFAAGENFGYIYTQFGGASGSGEAILTGFLNRFGGNIMHTMWAAWTGSFLGLMLLRRGHLRWSDFFAGVLPALVVHALSNTGLNVIGHWLESHSVVRDGRIYAVGTDPDTWLFVREYGNTMWHALVTIVTSYVFFRLLWQAQRDAKAWEAAGTGNAASAQTAPSAPAGESA